MATFLLLLPALCMVGAVVCHAAMHQADAFSEQVRYLVLMS